MRFSTQTNKILLFAGESRKAKMNTRKIGTVQEQRVAGWLKQHGYDIVEHNFSCRFGEIDLIARDGEYLVFVEVKYRKDNSSGYSLAAVNPAKQKTICKVARYFLTVEYHNVDIPCRFDVAGIDGDEIHWVKNAFEYIAIL